MTKKELDADIRWNLKNFAIDLLECVRNDIIEIADQESKYDAKWAKGLRYSTKVIDSYIECYKKENENNG